MTRILHTADIHLDSPLKTIALRDEALRDRLHAATRGAFTRLVDTALQEAVSAVLISGDLFDGAGRSAKTAAFLVSELDRLNAAGIPVFYIKGNHDAESPLTGDVELPANVHVFDGRGGRVQLPGLDVWIHGVSFSRRHAPDSLLDKFDAPVAGAVNIAMLHTSLGGAAGHDAYAPCSVAQLQSKGFDYWALGHIHRRGIHSQDPWIVMPGIPQGRDIGEAGPKSATLISIEEGSLTVSEVPTSVVEFLPLTVSATGLEQDDALRDTLRGTIQDAAKTLQSDNAILRVTVTGQSPRRWQWLRGQAQWQETAEIEARKTGKLWIEKLVFDLSDATQDTADASGTAIGELTGLMADICREPGFLAAAQEETDTVLQELAPGRLAALVPDESARDRLTERLAGTGAAQLVARMRGASD